MTCRSSVMTKSLRIHRSACVVFTGLIVTIMIVAGSSNAQDSLWTQRYTGRIDADTMITVRINQDITADTTTDQRFLGYVAEDVRNHEGIITVPGGATVELVVRRATNGELRLDLSAISFFGQRYIIEDFAN